MMLELSPTIDTSTVVPFGSLIFLTFSAGYATLLVTEATVSPLRRVSVGVAVVAVVES